MREVVLWRDSGLAPKVGPLDARAIFPLGIWLFHWSTVTATIALVGIGALFVVQRMGMTPAACARYLRLRLLIGDRRETRENERHWRQRCRW